jgi:RND family efflux transporter MFP subunit
MNRTLLLGLAVAGAAACHQSSAETRARPATPAPSFEVQAETLAVVMPVEGTVAARHRAEISTRLMARVTAVPAELGAGVRAGQPLLRLGVEDVAAHRAKAEAAVAAARAAGHEAARHAARMDTLLAQDAVAPVQRDQAHLNLRQAESQLAMAEAALAEVETAAGYARIAAPFDGVVVSRMVDPGDLAAPGQPLLVLESVGPRDAVLAVPADLAAGIQPGDTLTVTTRGGARTGAAVRAVAGGADPATRTIEVRATVPADWPSGVAVTALIPAGSRTGVAVPAAAVVRRGQLTGVRVVVGDRTVLRWVRLGRTVGDRIEVLSGLEPGERIAP